MAYITGLKKQVEGTTITITDNDYDKVQDLQLKGNTTQSSTPTPSTPVNVEVVTGGQEINVTGKNLLGLVDGTYSNNGITATVEDGEIILNGTATANSFITNFNNLIYLESGTYTLSLNNTTTISGTANTNLLRLINESGETISGVGSDFTVVNHTKTFTLSESGYYRFQVRTNSGTTYNNFVIKPQLEKGSTASECEAYKGKTYEIDLGKNLIYNKNGTQSGTYGGVTYTFNEDGSVKVKGTATSNYNFYLMSGNNSLVLEPGTYTLSGGISNRAWIRAYDGTTYQETTSNNIKTFTVTQKSTFTISLRIQNGQTVDDTFYPMLEKGNSKTNYVQHKEPIELCKIDTYQDSIKKATGKNLINTVETNKGTSSSGAIGSPNTAYLGIDDYVSVKPNTTYSVIFQHNVSNANLYVSSKDANGDYIDRVSWATNRTFTTGANTHYIFFYLYKSGVTFETIGGYVQLEENSTPTTYEPYGTGWYIEKQIGKVVFDGSETGWSSTYSGTANYFYKYRYLTDRKGVAGNVDNIKNNFYPFANIGSTNEVQGMTITPLNEIRIRYGTEMTLENFKIWLSTHNLFVYYVLANPTYTFIEDEELINQLESVRLLEGLNNIIVSNSDLSSPIKLTYLSTDNPYLDVIYSQDDKNKLKIWFDDVELENAGYLCEKITKKSRILAETGQKIFSLSNFMATELEIILHGINLDTIKDQVKISIGTLIDEQNQTYEYIPLGVFNIENTPIINQNKITIKLRDNRVKFDFNYDAQPLLEANGGRATKRQILEDICLKAKVKHKIPYFKFENDEISIYDNTIKATMYIDYLAEQCGNFPALDRDGDLIFINLSDSYTWKIPKSILPQPYTLGTPYTIERVVYETGIIKYETSNDETLDTLYLNSANPYITSQSQVDYILSKFSNLKLDTVITQKMLGNPEIDPWDLIEVYDDATHEILFKTIANNIYTYNGKNWQSFSTEIGKEQRKENVTVNSEPTFKKWVKSEIDNANAQLIIQAGQIAEKLDESDFTKAEIIVKINDNTSQIKIDADNVDLEANDVLNILSGNTINLTGKNIQIASDNFNVDANGDLTAHSATLEDIEIKDGQIYIPIDVDYDYTQADYQRALDIYLERITPTQEDLDKYDINGDGQIDLQDVMTILKLVRTGLSHSNPGKIIFKADGANSKISIINSLNQDIVKFDFNGISVTDLDNNVTTIRAGSIGIRQGTNITEIYPPEILYDDATGTQGTVTLSTNADNFKYLEIYYYKNIQEKQYSSVKVYEPNGKNVLLLATWYGTDVSSTVPAMYVYREKAIISGTSITRAEAGAVAINTLGQSSAWQPDALYITRVVGYR